MLIFSFFLWIARLLPRGGFQFLRIIASWFKFFESYPIQLSLVPGIEIKADLRESIWYPLWRYGHYPHQIWEDTLALTMLRPNDIVWDIGANIGYTALIFARAIGSKGMVVAFEPSVKGFRYLCRTVESHKNIHAINLAISDFVGTLRFADQKYLDLSKVLAPGERGGYEVKCTTLDQWLDSYGGPPPNFIKIDVEGHEAAVIRGAKTVLSENCPIILFEALTKELESAFIATLLNVSKWEYIFYRIGKGGKLSSIDHFPEPGCTNNYLAVCKWHMSRLNSVIGDYR